MAVLHVTEAELVKNIEEILKQVREGAEVVIEQDNRPVATIKPSKPVVGRKASEIIEILRSQESKAAMDAGFARDVEEGRRLIYRQPWNPPYWE
jgi:antitoxin (DNA-binding transcriptional repressor) of toxin-antitoxin stability system